MKALMQFLFGIALVSCFPGAVEAGAQGNPQWFLVGGLIGLLPRLYQRWIVPCRYRQDITITPDPLAFDAQMVADGVAVALQKVFAEARPVQLKLNTVQLDRDCWRSYEVFLDVAQRKVVVGAGGVVNGRGKLVKHDNNDVVHANGAAHMIGNLQLDYLARMHIAADDGLFLRLEQAGETTVVPRLLLGGNGQGKSGHDQRQVWAVWLLGVLILWNLSRPEMIGPAEMLDVARVLIVTGILPAVLCLFLGRAGPTDPPSFSV